MEYDITTNKTELDNGQVLYTYTIEKGVLDASFRPNVGWFGIANLNVDSGSRRQGIAKCLLRKALEDALLLDAKFIYAAITSRECLDAMVNVFGRESVNITDEGTYSPKEGPDRYDASAMLNYKLSDSL